MLYVMMQIFDPENTLQARLAFTNGTRTLGQTKPTLPLILTRPPVQDEGLDSVGNQCVLSIKFLLFVV